MSDKLKSAKSTPTTAMRATSVTMTDRVKENRKVPTGATIVTKTVRTETEEIENGWLISKNYDITYKAKGATSNDYAYYTEKWYSKTDPLEIKLTDKSLADEFSDD